MREEETPTVPLIVVRVTVDTMSVDELVARCARYFRGADIVFVPTEGIQPPGRRVRFVFALADGTDLVSGEGVVLRMRRDSGDVRRPPGMELRYQILDEQSQIIVERLLSSRQPTVPPYVSMRIEGVSDSQQVTLTHQKLEPTPLPIPLLPTMVKPPALPSPPLPSPPPSLATPSNSSSSLALAPTARMATLVRMPTPLLLPPTRMRALGVAVATLAAMVAMVIAMAMMRHAPRPRVAVGGNGVVVAAPDPPAGVAPPVAAGPRPASTGGARPPPSAPHARAGVHPIALHVQTSPTGSTVFVDGEERGASPLTVAVAAGAHDIVAERPRWISAHAHVDGPGRVQLTLERPLARLRVTSTPSGAAVRLDGRDIGATPLDVDAAAYELHHLLLELDGHVWRRKVYLRPQGGAVRVGPRRSVDETGAIRVAHDLGERVRP
jgi:hypothetical protein